MIYAVIENPVTGERGIVRRAPATASSPLIADLYARPGAAVVGEHVHPGSTETFTVVRIRPPSDHTVIARRRDVDRADTRELTDSGRNTVVAGATGVPMTTPVAGPFGVATDTAWPGSP